jgi:hypothetical protein
MSEYTRKFVIIAVLVSCLAPIYYSMPSGDRMFAVWLWLGFCGVIGGLIWFTPILHCPRCGWCTPYHTYSWGARWTGYMRRYIKCRKCHCIIDRLTGESVGKLPPEEGRALDRLVRLIRLRLGLYWLGGSLIVGSLGIGFIILRIALDGAAHQDRARNVLLGCGLVFLVGVSSLATAWWLKRKTRRLANDHHIELAKGMSIRW